MHKQKKRKLKPISIRFDPSIYEQLEKLAGEENRTIAGLVRHLVAQGLDEDRQKAEV